MSVRLAEGHGERSLILIDLDNLKSLNDRHGHGAGDRALRTLAAALRAVSGDLGTAARIGGDEFAMALPGASPERTRDLADRLRRALPRLPLESGGTARLTVSVGAAAVHGRIAPADLIAAADRALYAAKSAGRDRAVVVALNRTLAA